MYFHKQTKKETICSEKKSYLTRFHKLLEIKRKHFFGTNTNITIFVALKTYLINYKSICTKIWVSLLTLYQGFIFNKVWM